MEAEKEYVKKLGSLQLQLDQAKEEENWGQAEYIKKQIVNLESAISGYTWTKSGAGWLRMKSINSRVGEIRVTPNEPVKDKETLRRIGELFEELKGTKESYTTAQLVANGALWHGSVDVRGATPLEVSSSSPPRGTLSSPLTAEEERQTASQLESSVLKGIMRPTTGYLFEAWSTPEDGSASMTIKFRMLETPPGQDYYKNELNKVGTITLRGTPYTNRSARMAYYFEGQARQWNKEWLKQGGNDKWYANCEKDTSGAFSACTVTVQKYPAVEKSYIFRMESARSALGPSGKLANVYQGVHVEDSETEFMSLSRRAGATLLIPERFHFYASFDKGEFSENAGSLNYRLLRSGAQAFTEYTGTKGVESVRSGKWDHPTVYYVDQSQVNVPFLAATSGDKGRLIRFIPYGKSGLPEAEVSENARRSQTDCPIDYRVYALWAPRQTDEGRRLVIAT
jgi:hypothetical protein